MGQSIGDWDNETFPQRRAVTYPDTISHSLGKPQVLAKQTHYLRTQANDWSNLSMAIEMDGEPFADSFNMQIRLVSTRVD